MARPLALVWTEPALDDLDEIASWIAVDDNTAASLLVQRVVSVVERLSRFPKSGRRVPELPRGTQYREVVVPPCRVFYRQEKRRVLIVHVMRGERLFAPERLR